MIGNRVVEPAQHDDADATGKDRSARGRVEGATMAVVR